MKNIIIGPAFPLRGGIANHNEALCRAFNKKKNASAIISFSLQYPSFLFPGTTQFDNGTPPSDIQITSEINSINPFTWFRVAKKIRKLNPDYVIVRYWLPFMAPCLGTIARLIKRNKKIKIIAITDNVIPHEKRIGDSMLTQYFVNACDAFVVMAKSVKEDLKKFTDNPNVICIPHPIYDIFGEIVSKQAAQQHLQLNVKDKHILFFGFIRKYKGLDLLLEAMGNQRIKEMGIKLIVAGEHYEDKTIYENLIKQYELEKNIILKTHYIPKEEVKYYFCAADLIAQPYHTATQSGVTQIAYNFERPMLVTDVGGLAEIVPAQKVGYVVEKNSQAIADAILDFYQNNREQRFTENTKGEKKRFLWETFVEEVEKLVKQL